jgi:hypothetical protein
MALDRADARRRVSAEVNYVRNAPPSGAPPLTFVTEAEDRSTMVVLPGRQVWIEDLRGIDTSLDREGFQLVPHASAVADFDAIEEDAAVDQTYIGEVGRLVSAVTGADEVIVLGGGKKRYGERAAEKLASLKNAKPARYVHGDVTDVSAPMQATGLAGAMGFDLKDYRRWALYNIWRVITPPPQDVPLAVCDARTLALADGVPVVAETEIRGFGAFTFETSGYLYNPAHRWCFFRDMTPAEVLVFKTHDSDPARAHRVAHTAFTDPACPAGAPTRGSVEARALALFR